MNQQTSKQLQGVVQTTILAAPNWPSRWQRTKWISYGLIAVFIGHKDLEAMDTGDSISPYNVPGKQGTTGPPAHFRVRKIGTPPLSPPFCCHFVLLILQLLNFARFYISISAEILSGLSPLLLSFPPSTSIF